MPPFSLFFILLRIVIHIFAALEYAGDTTVDVPTSATSSLRSPIPRSNSYRMLHKSSSLKRKGHDEDEADNGIFCTTFFSLTHDEYSFFA